MVSAEHEDARSIVAAVRRAAAVHDASWAAMVPDQFTVEAGAEAAEEQAYRAMAVQKARLREHIGTTYGVSIDELVRLAIP